MVSRISGQKNTLHRLAHPGIFHRRLAHDGRRVDRVLAMRDAGDVKHRVLLFHGVEARVIAERTLPAQFVQFHVAFEHDLRMRRNFQVHGFALHHLDRLAGAENPQ